VTFLVRASDSINANNYGIRLLTLTLPVDAGHDHDQLFVAVRQHGNELHADAHGHRRNGAADMGSGSGSHLPPGLTLSPPGVLSGTPLFTGQFSFSVRVTDAAGSVSSVRSPSRSIRRVRCRRWA